MDRARRAGEIVDLIDLDIERKADVVPHEFEPRVAHEVIEIALVPGEQIIDAQYLVAALKQAIDQDGTPGSLRRRSPGFGLF